MFLSFFFLLLRGWTVQQKVSISYPDFLFSPDVGLELWWKSPLSNTVSWTSPLALVSLSFNFLVSIALGFFQYCNFTHNSNSHVKLWTVPLEGKTNIGGRVLVLMVITRVRHDYCAHPCDTHCSLVAVMLCTLPCLSHRRLLSTCC